jgi:hypothetical protein
MLLCPVAFPATYQVPSWSWYCTAVPFRCGAYSMSLSLSLTLVLSESESSFPELSFKTSSKLFPSSCKLRPASPNEDNKTSLLLLLLLLLLLEVETTALAPTTFRVAVAKRSNDTSSNILPLINVVIAIASKMDVLQYS